MIRGSREPAMEFRFILTFSDISTTLGGADCSSIKFYDLRRSISLICLEFLNLLPSTASATKIFGFKSLGIIPSTIL